MVGGHRITKPSGLLETPLLHLDVARLGRSGSMPPGLPTPGQGTALL
jgi:hypothetical protein